MISGRRVDSGCLPAITLVVFLAISAAAQSQLDDSPGVPAVGSITGQVVSETGNPIQNATVVVRGSSSLFQPRVLPTDNEGRFQLNGLSPALYGVSATAPAYAFPPRSPDSPPEYYRLGDTVSITLIKGGVITGTVTSSSGDPLVQVAVWAMQIRDAMGQAPRNLGYQQMRMTDDRGIYRIYGLVPGTYLVAAGGRSFVWPFADGFEGDAPTYAPSSTRDTASEILVRGGEETSGVDIRYRGYPGRTISGHVIGPLDPNMSFGVNVSLTQVTNDTPLSTSYYFQQPGGKGFAFHGVADGVYDLNAQYSSVPGETLMIEPRRITVKGSDITGLELTLKPLGSIEGRLVLEKLTDTECQNKRQPSFSETLVLARRNEKNLSKDQPRGMPSFSPQGSPNKTGDFQLRSVTPGQYNFSTRFFAKYWYLRSILREAAPAQPATQSAVPVPKPTDVARLGLTVKSGDRVTGLTVTLSEGAASLRGTVKLPAGQSVPPKLYVHLVPAEKENEDDVLRFFVAPVGSDGTFSLNNLPPGRYWAFTRAAPENESQLESKVQLPEESELRGQLRGLADAGKNVVEFKPCQNMANYSLTLAPVAVKN